MRALFFCPHCRAQSARARTARQGTRARTAGQGTRARARTARQALQGRAQGRAQARARAHTCTHMHMHTCTTRARWRTIGDAETRRCRDAGRRGQRNATAKEREAIRHAIRDDIRATYGHAYEALQATYRRPYRPGTRSAAQNGPNAAITARSGTISPSMRAEALRGAILELEHAEALRELPIVLHYRHATPCRCTRPLAKMPLQAPKNGPRGGRIEALRA